MPALKPQSARSLNWFAAMLLLAGWLIPAPSAEMLLSVLALLVVLAPAVFGAGRARVAALILAVLATGTALDAYPEFTGEQARYRQRAQERAEKAAPVPAAPAADQAKK